MSKNNILTSETQFIRTEKLKNYSMIDNSVLQDKRLSWKAKGIMCYILSLPVTWKIYVKEVLTHATDGKESFRNGMKELEEYGYIVKNSIRNEQGRFLGYNYIVIEKPEIMDITTEAGKPNTDNPISENPPLLRTNVKNELLNKEINKKVSKGHSDGTTDTLSEPFVFDKMEKKDNIFESATYRYGEERCKQALSIIDNFIDEHYPKYTGKKHGKLNKAQRMAFAVKILECEDETEIYISNFEPMFKYMLNNYDKKSCDPTILYATTPKVIGYWLERKYTDVDFYDLLGTSYAPVETYY
jgi:hypothetical protein